MAILFEPTPEQLAMRDAHVGILRKGVVCWNQWRVDNPQIIPMLFNGDIENIDLSDPGRKLDTNINRITIDIGINYVNLTNCNLCGANFRGANLLGANLSGSWAEGANFSGANLQQANLINVYFVSAIFSNSNLLNALLCIESKQYSYIEREFSYSYDQTDVSGTLYGADFDNACLDYADMTGCKMYSANLSNASLKYIKGLRLDKNYLRGSKIGVSIAGELNPWSKLQNKYTGMSATLNLIFLIVFFIPFIAKAAFWSAVTEIQINNQEALNSVVKISTDLSTVEWSSYEIWQLLLGVDKGGLFWIIPVMLILYNILRASLTIFVAKLSDAQDRSGECPAYNRDTYINNIYEIDFWKGVSKNYGWMTYADKVIQSLFWIAILSALFNIFLILNNEVFIPS